MPGVIAAGDQLTADAGLEILEQGGNAVDAAVAATFASFFSEIAMVHLGGSGIAQIFDPNGPTSRVYDFFSNMPGLGLPQPLNKNRLDFSEVLIDFGSATQSFFIGRGSVAVPGNIFGLCQMAADHGRLPLRQTLAPVIRLTRDGIIMNSYQATTCKLLQPIFTHTEQLRDIFLKDGHMLNAGDRLYIPHLSDTLEEIAATGGETIRSGQLARALVADQAEHGGLVTAEDLAHYEVYQQQPIRIPYRDHEILLPPPCSTGGVLTAFTLKLLSQFDLPQWPHGSAEYCQLFIEAMAATGRARRHWNLATQYLPPAQAVVRFLDDEFVADFAAEVAMALWKGRPSASVVEPPAPTNTSHLSVIDGDGMAVSITTTAGESAGYLLPGTGLLPNNILGEEDLHPNGFHNGQPGERINTMMTPTVVLKDGRIKFVTGSGGSLRIRSAIMHTLINAIDYDMALAEAVNAPRLHLENQIVQVEHGCDPTATAELEALGYSVNRWSSRSMYFGGAHSVGLVDGQLVATGDSRRGGSAAYTAA